MDLCAYGAAEGFDEGTDPQLHEADHWLSSLTFDDQAGEVPHHGMCSPCLPLGPSPPCAQLDHSCVATAASLPVAISRPAPTGPPRGSFDSMESVATLLASSLGDDTHAGGYMLSELTLATPHVGGSWAKHPTPGSPDGPLYGSARRAPGLPLGPSPSPLGPPAPASPAPPAGCWIGEQVRGGFAAAGALSVPLAGRCAHPPGPGFRGFAPIATFPGPALPPHLASASSSPSAATGLANPGIASPVPSADPCARFVSVADTAGPPAPPHGYEVPSHARTQRFAGYEVGLPYARTRAVGSPTTYHIPPPSASPDAYPRHPSASSHESSVLEWTPPHEMFAVGGLHGRAPDERSYHGVPAEASYHGCPGGPPGLPLDYYPPPGHHQGGTPYGAAMGSWASAGDARPRSYHPRPHHRSASMGVSELAELHALGVHGDRWASTSPELPMPSSDASTFDDDLLVRAAGAVGGRAGSASGSGYSSSRSAPDELRVGGSAPDEVHVGGSVHGAGCEDLVADPYPSEGSMHSGIQRSGPSRSKIAGGPGGASLSVRSPALKRAGSLARAPSAGLLSERPARTAARKGVAAAAAAAAPSPPPHEPLDAAAGESGGSPMASALSAQVSPELARTGSKKKHNPWTLAETQALVDGVRIVGAGKWAEVKRLPIPDLVNLLAARSPVDLKDKWRNLTRVARLPRAALKVRLSKGGDVPLELILAVKELVDPKARDE